MQHAKTPACGTVYFIGAGPGDPELVTVKGKRLISEATLVLYAGSLVPKALVECTATGAKVVDSSSLTLGETHSLIKEFAMRGGLVARVHTGDPSLYGAMREQIELLDADGIPYSIVPGVSAAFAAAAAAKVSFTVPELVQSLSITRLAGRTPVPAGQSVQELAAHKGFMAIYLSGAETTALPVELRKAKLAEDTSIIMAYRVGWPEEKIFHTTLENLEGCIQKAHNDGLTRQMIFLVLPGEKLFKNPSRLYAEEFKHGFRP